MSDDRPAVYGIDMVPETIPDWALVESPKPMPRTPIEQHEHVNADVLRRALHVRSDALIRHIRSLPPEGPINVRNLVRIAMQDFELSIEQYLTIERTYRNSRA